MLAERPDILHVHNTFPLLSPAIFPALRNLPVATVLTLHNYRTVCAAAIPLRDGRVCTDCLDDRSVWPALRHGCYRGSRLATLPLAAMIALHRRLGTWGREVDALIALTAFQKDTLVRAGLPEERLYVKPHFYAAAPQPLAWAKRDDRVVFVGRLQEEKGLHVLIEAWRLWGDAAPQLDIVGDGVERASLERLVIASGLQGKVTFRGQLPFAETQAIIAASRLLVLPSLCFEGFPMVIREAFALGVPVACSRLGSMPCLVEQDKTGALFEPGNPNDLMRSVQALWRDQAKLEAMSGRARNEFAVKYDAKSNEKILLDIYRQAIQHRHDKLRGRST